MGRRVLPAARGDGVEIGRQIVTIIMHTGDCREVLRTLPDESVHCVVTSPPYFGLRDYGTATWEGGDPDCDHSPEMRGGRFATPVSSKQASNTGTGTASNRDCPCGARRIDSQLGLEPTPDAYIAEMVAVFRELRRVLRKDGTCWLNLGDSYGTTGGDTHSGFNERYFGKPGGADNKQDAMLDGIKDHTKSTGLRPKNLLGIPWRVAFALQADGWYLRQDIIWSKPNPMPESVRDRCTKAHEYIFLLSKSERYYYDADAIKEPSVDPIGSAARYRSAFSGRPEGSIVCPNDKDGQRYAPKGMREFDEMRNKRSVWEVTTQPFPEAHFATFPPALIEPCILAGCPEKACAKCGAPWVRQTDEATYYDGEMVGSDPQRKYGYREYGRGPKNNLGSSVRKTLGFSPSCSCDAGTVGGTVLDPFGGAGTTGLVADRLGRNAILIELNPDYAAMAEGRIRGDLPLFADVQFMAWKSGGRM
jgi:DNA modification methylase